MSDENLLLYLNLTGELFYIVTHRMNSQNIKLDLQTKVSNDLAIAICNPEVIQSFIYGKLKIMNYKLHQMKALLSQIVHSSIMNINDYSLEKLFELTLIATKYQFTLCQHPKDILIIVLNHIDTIRKYLTNSIAIKYTEDLHNILINSYGQKSTCCMKDYLHEIRNYVQEINLKMTNLINLNLQQSDGKFIIDDNLNISIHPECTKPGTIEYGFSTSFQEQEIPDNSITFDDNNEFIHHRKKSSLELDGDRIVKIGLSLYNNIEKFKMENLLKDTHESEFQETTNLKENNQIVCTTTKKVTHGLDLCSTLLGCDDLSSTTTLPLKVSTSSSFSMSDNPTCTSQNISFNSMKTFSTSTSTSTSTSVPIISYGDINIVHIDARYNRSESKDVLSAIAKDFDSIDFIDNDTSDVTELNISSSSSDSLKNSRAIIIDD